jgi:hypothetical protein
MKMGQMVPNKKWPIEDTYLYKDRSNSHISLKINLFSPRSNNSSLYTTSRITRPDLVNNSTLNISTLSLDSITNPLRPSKSRPR